MPKFRPRKGGKFKSGKRYITYDANLPISKLRRADFIKADGSVREYEAVAEEKQIVLKVKEDSGEEKK